MVWYVSSVYFAVVAVVGKGLWLGWMDLAAMVIRGAFDSI